MENKTFMFVSSWIEPLRKLSLQERWNLMEAIVEYALTEKTGIPFSPVEDMAFTFIRADIERMQSKYKSVCQKRRQAANSRWNGKGSQTDYESAEECKSIASTDEHYETDTDTDTKPETDKPSMTATGVCVRGNAGKTASVYDDSQLLTRFFDSSNQARLEALAMKHRVEIADLRRLAEEITVQWALTDKTHESYHDASLHLVYVLADKISRERQSRLKAIADGIVPACSEKGVLGVDEYIDSDGRRTYNGVDFIPHDAPPRPGKAFWWNETTGSWDDIQ